MKKQDDKVTLSGPALEEIGALLSASLKETPAGSCLSLEEIATLIDGKNTVEERSRLMKHLASCDRCYETFLLTASLSERTAPVPDAGERELKTLRKPYLSRSFRMAASLIVALFSLFLFYKIVFIPQAKEQQVQPIVLSEEAAPPRPAGEYKKNGRLKKKALLPGKRSSGTGERPGKAEIKETESYFKADDAVESGNAAGFEKREKAAKKEGFRETGKKKGDARPGRENKGAPAILKAKKGAPPTVSKKASWEGEIPGAEKRAGKAAAVSKKAKAKTGSFQAQTQPEAKLRERQASREEKQQAVGQTQYAQQERDVQQYRQAAAVKNTIAPGKEEVQQVQPASVGGIVSQRGAPRAALEQLNRDISRPGIIYIAAVDMGNYFKEAVVLSGQLQREFEALRKEAAATGNSEKIDSYVKAYFSLECFVWKSLIC